MRIEEYSRIANFCEVSELERVALLAYYYAENKNEQEFKLPDLCNVLVALGFASPNLSRLRKKIRESRDFIKGSQKDTHRLSVQALNRLRQILPQINESEEIRSDDSLLPEILFEESRRGYLIKLAKQINASYANNLFDACSLMMRRLLEILLIHVFQKLGKEAEIKDEEGNYQNLKTLINKAKSSKDASLSPQTRRTIDDFRELGNLSAHLITYSCRRDDIRPMRMDFRAIIEELLYKAGLTSGHS